MTIINERDNRIRQMQKSAYDQQMCKAWSERFNKAYMELYIQIADHTLPDGFYSGYIAAVKDMRIEKRKAVISEFIDAYEIEKIEKGWADSEE